MSYYSLHELRVTFNIKVKIYYLLDETQVNFCELLDEPTKTNSVALVAIVIEEDIPISAQFINKSSKILLPSIHMSIYSIYFSKSNLWTCSVK